MEELTDQAKQMLEALKAEETPTKASSNRMWAAVAGGAAAGAVVGLSKGKLLLLGALGITGVVALVIWGGPAPVEPEPAAGSGARGEPVAAVEAAPRVDEELPVEPTAEPAPEPTPEPPAPASEPPPEPRSEARPSKSGKNDAATAKGTSKPAPAPAVEDSADLERELSLLAKAKRALRSGDAAGALASLKAHGKEFPGSTFAEERDLLRMTALCELGKRDEARREADAFLHRNPSSALSTQVRRVCEGE